MRNWPYAWKSCRKPGGSACGRQVADHNDVAERAVAAAPRQLGLGGAAQAVAHRPKP